MLELLEDEVIRCLGLLGVNSSPSSTNPTCIRPRRPTCLMSSAPFRCSTSSRIVTDISRDGATRPRSRSADALLFDLGRVVIDIDFNKVLACWAGHAGCEPAKLSSGFADETFRRHETGHASDAEFFADLRTTLGIGFRTNSCWKAGTRSSPARCPGSTPLLARAAMRLPLYAFSNTNRPHVAHFSKPYADVLSHFREIFLSCAIGLRKPDASRL